MRKGVLKAELWVELVVAVTVMSNQVQMKSWVRGRVPADNTVRRYHEVLVVPIEVQFGEPWDVAVQMVSQGFEVYAVWSTC